MEESNQREVAPKFLSPTVSVIFLVNFPGKISSKSLIQHPQPKKSSNNDPFKTLAMDNLSFTNCNNCFFSSHFRRNANSRLGIKLDLGFIYICICRLAVVAGTLD
jgi:hypothetical protein